MALDVGRRFAEAERAYEWLVEHAALRRLVARVLPGRRRQGAHARHQRHVLRRERRVAPLLDLGRHRLPRATCSRSSSARSTSRSITSTRPARSSGTPIPNAIEGKGALLTGSSSIYSSLRCAIAAAERLGRERPDWELSLGSLAIAIAHRPERFLDKERWAMDWYYPILGGVLRGHAAEARIASKWDTFVAPGRGVRCVSDQPWITAAETCELVMALDAIGLHDRAHELFGWVQFLRHDDGSYWTGMNFAGRPLRRVGRVLHRRAADVEQRRGRARRQRARRRRPDGGPVPRRRLPPASRAEELIEAGAEIEHARRVRPAADPAPLTTVATHRPLARVCDCVSRSPRCDRGAVIREFDRGESRRCSTDHAARMSQSLRRTLGSIAPRHARRATSPMPSVIGRSATRPTRRSRRDGDVDGASTERHAVVRARRRD